MRLTTWCRELNKAMATTLTRQDHTRFVFSAYFGTQGSPRALCLKRAYLDTNRTLTGVGALPLLRKEAEAQLHTCLDEVRTEPQYSTSRNGFDIWHRATCDGLCRLYGSYDYRLFTVGHAQKWVNMTLKYIFTLGEDLLPGFGHLVDFCHAPLDNGVITRLCEYGFPGNSVRWTQIQDYDEYLGYQNWIRAHFSLIPLDAEFYLWLEDDKTKRDEALGVK